MTLDPKEYPAKCTVDGAELATIKDLVTDEDSPVARNQDAEWPPRDRAGNVYPIFFTADELTDTGNLYDSFYTQYDPFGGNLEPITREGMSLCNAPLNNWRDRYPEVRYCGRYSDTFEEEYTYCPSHKGRKNTMQSAEEIMQTGLFTSSIDRAYEKLGPWLKLMGWGMFESLMGESSYEFGVEYEQKTFDFTDANVVPDGVDEDGTLTVKCGYPTQHVDPALSLFQAAMMSLQILLAQSQVMYEDREEGTAMMESKTIEAAQLTAPPSEHDPSPQQFKTLETWSEHHLNLPLSRVIRDRPKLLERGGVDPTADDANDNDIDADEVVLEIEAEAEEMDTKDDTGTDPNFLGDDYTGESEKIKQAASEGQLPSDGD